MLALPREHLQRGLHALDALSLHLDFGFDDFLLLPLHADALPEAEGAAPGHVVDGFHDARRTAHEVPSSAGWPKVLCGLAIDSGRGATRSRARG